MKKKMAIVLILGLAGIAVCVLAAITVAKSVEKNKKFNIKGEYVASAEVRSSYDKPTYGDPKKTSDREQIDILMDCIKNVKVNNENLMRDVEIGPSFYEITFVYVNGEVETYEYRVYPATKCRDPFRPFYDLFAEDDPAAAR